MGTRISLATPVGRGSAELSDSFGVTLFVNTVAGNDGNSGLTPDKALDTMDAALDKLAALHAAVSKSADNSTIYVIGDVREQLSAPLGVSGVRIVGLANGNNRHDNGMRWRQAATATNAPLLIVHEQGWEFHNILFVPESGYSALKFWRAEDATHPDGSHAIVRGCKFIGPTTIGTPLGIGIEDYGGMHHQLIEDNEFADLDFAIKATNVSIASPLRNTIRRNSFDSNKNDIGLNANLCRILDNTFNTAYNSSTHPIIINLAYTADASGKNVVHNNVFADAITAIDDDHGYIESTGDVWGGNWASTSTSAAAAAPWGGVPADS